MRTSQREPILEAALELLRAEQGGAITLQTTAERAGLTKAGLMYHFPTKQQLMCAVVDHVADRWEAAMLAALDTRFEEASAADRIRAYVCVACSGEADRADYSVFSDAAYLPVLSARWTERFARWFEPPPGSSQAQRVQLTLARLAADGFWTADATGLFAPSGDDRDAVVALITDLIGTT